MTRRALATPLLLGALACASIVLRVRELDAGLWVDEGLSYGIADRPLTDIPGTLRQDGSPPLYYLLLHLYTRAFGVRSEVALHALSLAFAVLAILVAYALAASLFGRRAGWMAAALAASIPYLNQYAQEARMYTLVVLLAITTVATFVGAFVLGRGRRWTLAFAVAQTALLYTHNWGLFLGAGLARAFLLLCRDRLREGLLAAGIVLVLYAPWIPSLVFQVRHTGAPWANAPDFADLYEAPQRLLGLTGQYLLLVAGVAGLAALARRSPERRAAIALAVAAAGALLMPWLVSQASPSWSYRYLAVVVAPLLLLAALGTSRAGLAGVAAVALTALVGLAWNVPSTKSNVDAVAAAIAPSLRPGDHVISTQPEQVAVLHYYLREPAGLRYATVLGPVADVGVTDWRDGVERLRETTVAENLEPVLDEVPPGGRVALVTPDFGILGRWRAPWSELVRVRSLTWEDAMRRDPRFRVVTVEPANPVARPNELRATVFVRR